MTSWNKFKLSKSKYKMVELPEPKKDRIKEISQDGTPAANYKKPIIILVLTIISALAAIAIITFINKKPASFLDVIKKDDKSQQEKPFESVPKEILQESTNVHIQKGKESYSKKYFTDAIAEFNEVIESDASDQDKAIALTYLGMISDERGDFQQAIEYYQRALKYDNSNADIYKNLSIAYRHNKEYALAIENAQKAVEINSNDLNTRLLLGNIYYDMKYYKEAVEQYSEALKLAPENASLLYNLGSALLKQGDELSGIEYFKKAAQSDKIGEVAFRSYSRLGVMYTERQEYELAEDYLKKAVSLRPQDPVARYNLGIVYLRQNKTALALTEFEKAQGLGEEDSAILENIAEAYFSMKEYDKSLEVYNKVMAHDSRNIKILSRLGEIYYEKGELDKALELFRKITVIEPTTENARIAYLNMGNIFDDTEQYDAAIEAYRKALTISDKDDSTYYNLGIAYKHAGKPDHAIDAWKRASELNENDPRAFTAIADYYYESKLYDLAEKEYQSIIQKWPSAQDAHFKMATIYYKRDELQFALKAYERVIQINSTNDFARKALLNSAIIISKINKDEQSLSQARQMIEKALLMKPGDPEALFTMGIQHFKEEMYDKAIETFYQVIKASRESSLIAESYNNIGKSYYQKKEYKKALQAFTRAVDENPSNEEFRINRKSASQAYEEELAHENN